MKTKSLAIAISLAVAVTLRLTSTAAAQGPPTAKMTTAVTFTDVTGKKSVLEKNASYRVVAHSPSTVTVLYPPTNEKVTVSRGDVEMAGAKPQSSDKIKNLMRLKLLHPPKHGVPSEENR